MSSVLICCNVEPSSGDFRVWSRARTAYLKLQTVDNCLPSESLPEMMHQKFLISFCNILARRKFQLSIWQSTPWITVLTKLLRIPRRRETDDSAVPSMFGCMQDSILIHVRPMLQGRKMLVRFWGSQFSKDTCDNHDPASRIAPVNSHK